MQMSFLPEPPYNPRWPKENTLAEKALQVLLTGKKVSHPQFEVLTGSWRLAAHIYTLKRLGWPITKDMLPLAGCDEQMRERHYDVYYLPDDLLNFIRGVLNGSNVLVSQIGLENSWV